MLRNSLVRFSVGALFAASFAWGCAAELSTSLDGAGGGGLDDGAGGAGAEGGMGGGTGGGGGDGNLCEQDCGAVAPPACHVSVCNDGSYAGAVGQCVVVPADEGTECDDGQFCTTGDACQAGVCVGGPANDCGMTPAECEAVVCDEGNKTCGVEPSGDGMPCTSDDLCVTGSTCSGGVCTGGAAKDCFFAPVPDECHVAVCNPSNGECEPEPGNEGGECIDQSDLCTVGKTCTAGQCLGGQPMDCSHLSSGCNVGLCDAALGSCTTMAAGEGQLCDDVDACTSAEICTAGVCGGGSPVTTCSQTADGCCPSSCTAQNDYDCNCPGTFVNGICVFLTSPSNSYPLGQAQSVCTGLGAGWGLCDPALLCDQQTLNYLGTSGCECTGGTSACNCGSSANVYVHVTGPDSPYYIRNAAMVGCGATACTDSVSESCGVALCCK